MEHAPGRLPRAVTAGPVVVVGRDTVGREHSDPCPALGQGKAEIRRRVFARGHACARGDICAFASA
jgi:hypothetical protein